MGSDLVYSSELGRMCPVCEQPVKQCRCASKKGSPSRKGDGQVRVSRQTKGRKGKGVSIITGLPLDIDQLRALAKELKRRCATGGTVKGNDIEIQGDHRETLVKELIKRGFEAKSSGG